MYLFQNAIAFFIRSIRAFTFCESLQSFLVRTASSWTLTPFPSRAFLMTARVSSALGTTSGKDYRSFPFTPL
jgi:hypothetical protein